MKKPDFSISVLVYRTSENEWCAQGFQYDIVGNGSNIESAIWRLMNNLALQADRDIANLKLPLESTPFAPIKIRNEFVKAEPFRTKKFNKPEYDVTLDIRKVDYLFSPYD